LPGFEGLWRTTQRLLLYICAQWIGNGRKTPSSIHHSGNGVLRLTAVCPLTNGHGWVFRVELAARLARGVRPTHPHVSVRAIGLGMLLRARRRRRGGRLRSGRKAKR
jgi:hypothetical protein